MRSWTELLLVGALVGCGASTPAVATPEARTQPCPLAEGRWTLQVPVPIDHALVAIDGACMLIDERQEATLATLATLPGNVEGADLLTSDPDAFFVGSGLLGQDARPIGRGTVTLLGERVVTQRWAATPEGMPVREITTAAVQQGADWLIVMLLTPPGDQEQRSHMQELLSAITRD